MTGATYGIEPIMCVYFPDYHICMAKPGKGGIVTPSVHNLKFQKSIPKQRTYGNIPINTSHHGYKHSKLYKFFSNYSGNMDKKQKNLRFQ